MQNITQNHCKRTFVQKEVFGCAAIYCGPKSQKPSKLGGKKPNGGNIRCVRHDNIIDSSKWHCWLYVTLASSCLIHTTAILNLDMSSGRDLTIATNDKIVGRKKIVGRDPFPTNDFFPTDTVPTNFDVLYQRFEISKMVPKLVKNRW